MQSIVTLLLAKLFVFVADLFEIPLHLSHLCDFLDQMMCLDSKVKRSLRYFKREVPELLVL